MTTGGIILYYIGVWFFSLSLLPLFTKFTGIGVNFYIIINYSGFLFLGFLINEMPLRRWMLAWAAGIFASGFLVTFLGTAAMSYKGTSMDLYLYDYASPNVILMSAAALYLLKQLQHDKIERSPLVRKASRAISDAGYGIYFIHVIVLELLNKGTLGFRPTDFIAHPLVAIPVTCLLTFVISFLIIAPIRKIPYLRNLVS